MIHGRRHDIDALRVVLLGLLICHHIGSLYTGWDWFLSSSYRSKLVGYLMAPLHQWRMGLLFLISGLALNFLRRDQHSDRLALLRNRSLRLLLPLAFGMVLIIPIQPYCQAVWHHRIEPGFPQFLAHYFGGGSWPHEAFYGADQGFATGQLWYLQYLWLYTLAVVLALPLLDSPAGRHLRSVCTSLRGPALLLVPAVPKLAALWFLSSQFPGRDMMLNDWSHHLTYFSCFLFGFLIATDEGFWATLRRARYWMLITAVALWPAYVLATHLADQATSASAIWLAISDALGAVYSWAAMAAALGWSATWLNRPFKWLPYASEAIFPWYILHQTIIVGLAFLLVPMKIGPVLEPLLIALATVLGCGLLHEYVIRRNTLLRPLFGLKERRSKLRVLAGLSVGSESPQPAGKSAD